MSMHATGLLMPVTQCGMSMHATGVLMPVHCVCRCLSYMVE